MGYVINSEGYKIKVDNPDGFCVENVVLMTDDTVLKEKYLIEIYKKSFWEKNSESEFIGEVVLDNNPTENEIIYHMAKHGVNRMGGYATVVPINVLDFNIEY